jgi:hypothetical protein
MSLEMKAGHLYGFSRDDLEVDPDICIHGMVVPAISTSSITDTIHLAIARGTQQIQSTQCSTVPFRLMKSPHCTRIVMPSSSPMPSKDIYTC